MVQVVDQVLDILSRLRFDLLVVGPLRDVAEAEEGGHPLFFLDLQQLIVARTLGDETGEVPCRHFVTADFDFDLGSESALHFVRDVKASGFTGQILVVTAGVSEPEAVRLVQAGVAGIFHKHNPPVA